MKPSSEWKVRAYEDKCRASRVFGSGEDRTTLWIEQGGPEPLYNLTLIGRPLRNPYGRAITVQFGPDEQPSLRSYISAESSKGRPVLSMFGVALSAPDPTVEASEPLSAIGEAREAAINFIEVRRSIRKPIRLDTGSMGKPFFDLANCAAQLAANLRLASMPISGMAVPPKPIGRDDWLPSHIYPNYLVRAGVGGKLRVRLTVSKQGRATGCYVLQSSRPQLFDDELCLSLMKRAEFEPAIDMDGLRTASYYLLNVKFSTR